MNKDISAVRQAVRDLGQKIVGKIEGVVLVNWAYSKEVKGPALVIYVANEQAERTVKHHHPEFYPYFNKHRVYVEIAPGTAVFAVDDTEAQRPKSD